MAYVFLNTLAARTGLPQETFDPVFRAASSFYHCAVFDRTGAFPVGPQVQILDPIVSDAPSVNFDDLCDERAGAIVDEATARDLSIQVLWSGGIDSTAALIALLQATQARGEDERLEVCLSLGSIREYPNFFRERIHGKVRTVPVAAPVGDYIDENKLVVTGEHGDQLFGSFMIEEHLATGLAFLPWQEVFPLVARARIADDAPTLGALQEALGCVMDAAPVAIRTLYDFLWWSNFALKWQTVSLRIPVSTGDRAPKVAKSMRHFFQTPGFQGWSIHHRPASVSHWAEYKMPAKQYIYRSTGDDHYLQNKTKEPSLKLVFDGEWRPKKKPPRQAGGFGDGPQRVYMHDNFVPQQVPLH